jgi:MFS family permease
MAAAAQQVELRGAAENPRPPSSSARLSVSVLFFVNGFILASWVPYIPSIKAAFGLSDGDLGTLLLAMPVGALVAMPSSGLLTRRVGSRAVASVACLALCAALPGPILAPGIIALALALGTLGACNGALDVSMNLEAVAVEVRYGRPIMSSFHALWGIGGLGGATVAGLAMWLGIPSIAHMVGVALVCATAVAGAIRKLPTPAAASAESGRIFAIPARGVLGLGLLAFAGLLSEGAMADWSAIYLRDTLGTSAALASAGFAAFSLAMAAGRFGGDRLVARFGAARLLRTSGAVAAGGLAVALLVAQPSAAIVGFFLVGLGIANVIPVLFATAGRLGAGSFLAAVATTGYVGYLAGPPAIGFIAEVTSLPVGLAVVCACCASIAVGARLVGVRSRS